MTEPDDPHEGLEVVDLEQHEAAAQVVTTGWREPTPTVDDENPPAFVDYRDWSPETSRVVSGPIGPAKNYPGTRWESKRAAKQYWEARAGGILEDLSIPGRWIFRIRRGT